MRFVAWSLALAVLLAPSLARADAKDDARAKYVEGVAFVQKAQWSDALVAFEASSKLFPSPATTLNMGACERALGRYVLARATLNRALDESATSGSPLPEGTVTEAKGFLAEIDRVLSHVTVTIEPREASVAVDGRPLADLGKLGAARPLLAAGVLPPGPGTTPPAATFDLVLDPGAHVFTLARKGFTDAVVNRTFAPGATTTLDLKLDLLPATLKITSTVQGAIVTVDDADVGPAPVDVLRPAGSHRVTVKKPGFLAYQTTLTVNPGEEASLRAKLLEDKPSVLERWWFWTGAAAIVAGGVVITYAATRPAPQPPPYDGGSTGWIVQPKGASIHF